MQVGTFSYFRGVLPVASAIFCIWLLLEQENQHLSSP